MTPSKLLAALAALFPLVAVHAQGYYSPPAAAPVTSPADLDSLLNPITTRARAGADLRAQMLRDAGGTVGFRGGIASRAQAIASSLGARSNELDTLFQFASVVGPGGALPPVIVEARDVASYADSQERRANRVFKIEKPERFVSVPPTWRDFLMVGLPLETAVDMPMAQAQPKNGDELTIWRAAVQDGWHKGEQQADAILEANFNRLKRDYLGMLTYSLLLQQGMISQTQVAESHQVVSGNGGQITIGDTLRRVTDNAQFQTDANQWRPNVGYDQVLLAQAAGTYATPLPHSSPAVAGVAPMAAIAIPVGMTAAAQVPASTAVSATAAEPAVNPMQSDQSASAVPTQSSQLVNADAEPAAAPVKDWSAKSGSTLREVMSAWSKDAGWTLRWDTDLDYPIDPPGFNFQGDFVEVAQRTFALYDDAKRSFRTHMSKGNNVLLVQEK